MNRFFRRAGALDPRILAGGLALLVLLWLLSGLGDDDHVAEAPAQSAEPTQGLRVMVRDSRAQDLTREAVMSATTAPRRLVSLRAEISARVAEVLVERGQRVSKGQLLLRLDARERPAQLDRARHLLTQRELQFDAASRLRREGHVSDVDFATSRTNLSDARAEVQRLESELERSDIRAPFDGVLENRPLEIGDFANVGDLLAQVIAQSSYLVVGDVGEDDVGFLRPGQAGRARLADGRTVAGRLHYVASHADAATRTFRVELLVEDDQERLILGSSASLMLPLEQVRAHVLDPASLALDAEGAFGVKAVDDQSRVVFHPARIAQNRDADVWLTGLPERLQIITVGQGFVAAGDQVRPVPEPR